MVERRKAVGTPALEWAAAAVGLLLLLVMLAIIGREAVGGADAPPAITVTARRIVAVAGGYVVEIEAGNSSGAAAAAVQVEGALRAGEAAIETSRLTFDYLPGRSRRAGGIFFTRDPRRYRLDLRALGYQEP